MTQQQIQMELAAAEAKAAQLRTLLASGAAGITSLAQTGDINAAANDTGNLADDAAQVVADVEEHKYMDLLGLAPKIIADLHTLGAEIQIIKTRLFGGGVVLPAPELQTVPAPPSA
jgi:hypothetical protein